MVNNYEEMRQRLYNVNFGRSSSYSQSSYQYDSHHHNFVVIVGYFSRVGYILSLSTI